MNRKIFSSILESLDKTINLQENFNTDLSMSELDVLLPKILSEERTDDLKSGMIISLRAALQQHKDFVEIMPIGMMVHRKGEIIYTNSEFRHLTGYESPEELIGQPVTKLVAAEYRAEIQNRSLNITDKGAFHNAPIELVGLKKTARGVISRRNRFRSSMAGNRPSW